MSLIELKRYFTSIEAEVDRTVLASHGIEAVTFDSDLNSAEGGGLASAARLMVIEEDLSDARAILSEVRD